MSDMHARNIIAPAAFLAALLTLPASAMRPSNPILPAPGRPMSPVILDAGHGGEDDGAIVRGVKEKDLALVFAKKLKARLARNRDLPVVMTREDDRYVTLDDRLVDSVDQGGSIFVSLHLNQVKGKKAAGAVVYSYGPEKLKKWRKRRLPDVPRMPAPPRVTAGDSARLSRAFSRSLRADGFIARSEKSDYYVLKNPAAPSVLIELGYLNNPHEAAKLANPAYQDRMVDSLAKAIERYSIDHTLRAEVHGPAAPKVVSKRR